MKLKYSDLVKTYNENLEDNLRGFKGGDGFLEAWVCDENVDRSLMNIVELARDEDIDHLEIELSEDYTTNLRTNWEEGITVYQSIYGTIFEYLSPDRRDVASALYQSAHKLGIERNFQIESLKDKRITISDQNIVNKQLFGDSLIKLEREINELLSSNYYIELSTTVDKNKRTERTGRS